MTVIVSKPQFNIRDELNYLRGNTYDTSDYIGRVYYPGRTYNGITLNLSYTNTPGTAGSSVNSQGGYVHLRKTPGLDTNQWLMDFNVTLNANLGVNSTACVFLTGISIQGRSASTIWGSSALSQNYQVQESRTDQTSDSNNLNGQSILFLEWGSSRTNETVTWGVTGTAWLSQKPAWAY